MSSTKIDSAIGERLNKLVRQRSGGRLFLEVQQPMDSLHSLSSLLDRALPDVPTK